MTALATYLDVLYGAEPAGYVETRWKLPNDGMGHEFTSVRDLDRLPALLDAKSRHTDVYVGVAPRTRHAGGRDAVRHAHALWADVDTTDAIAALETFDPAPSLIVNSGSGLHVYWALWPPADTDELEAANRKLQHHLGADPQSTDAARILRPPGTFNYKTGKPVPVTLEHVNVEVYTAAQVAGHLPDPQPAARVATIRSSTGPVDSDDALRTIGSSEYIPMLTGRDVGRDGKITCPFHTSSKTGGFERTPSLQTYDDPDRGWVCHGCGRGGSIIDFGKHLYAIEPRDRGYHDIRRRLADDLLERRAAA